MVGGLVEQQQVGLLQQQLAQRHPATLSTGQVVDEHLGRRAAQRVHGLVEPAVEVPRVGVVEVGLQVAHFGEQLVVVGVGVGQLLTDRVEPVELALDLADGLLDVLEHRLALAQRRLLLEHPDRCPGVDRRVTVRRVLEAGHDLEQGGLARAVGPDDTDLGAVQERERDVVEDDLVTVGLAHVAQREDVFSHDHASLRWVGRGLKSAGGAADGPPGAHATRVERCWPKLSSCGRSPPLSWISSLTACSSSSASGRSGRLARTKTLVPRVRSWPT